MQAPGLRTVGRVLALVFVVSLPVALAAQAASSAKNSSNDSPSKFDIFAGYSYLAPKGTVQVPQLNGSTVPYSYDAVNVGAIASGAYYFNRFVGVQAELAEHEWGQSVPGSNVGTHGNDDGFATFSGGMIFRFPSENITPFVHALVGASYIDGPFHNGYKWGPDLTVGGGMDYETPWFNHHLAIRVFQADYEYMHADFGPQASPPGGRANIDAARLSAGVVIHVGSLAPPPPVTLACSASPDSVFPGEPVTITATTGGLNPKDHVIYTLSGESVTATDNTAKVDTASLAPGQHTVNCNVKEGKPGKEGLKPWESAQATANYTVKEFEPPTISCSASPTTIKPGDTATVTATGVSPQNRPLTYSYSASVGTITGSGTTAEYSSAGAPTGAVGITCNVSDDKGHSASAQTSLTIEAPPPPPQPHAQALCSMSFANDKARPTRVDNEAKACLDQVALDLKQQADARAVIVGQSDDKEKATTEREEKYAAHHKRAKVEDFAAQRAVNAKDYLVTEQGIDASRISVATTPTDGQTVENYLVPAGANFSADVTGTTPVDETAVKPEARKPLPEMHHAK
jgi:outer membrane protein OmpA-like peptidoglycan-associated protein